MKYKIFYSAQLQPDSVTEFVLVVDADNATAALEKANMILLRGTNHYIKSLPDELWPAFTRDIVSIDPGYWEEPGY